MQVEAGNITSLRTVTLPGLVGDLVGVANPTNVVVKIANSGLPDNILFVAEYPKKAEPVEAPPAEGPRVQYLVSLLGTMDEIPVRIFDTEDAAREFCSHNFPHPTDPTPPRCRLRLAEREVMTAERHLQVQDHLGERIASA